MMSSYAVCRVWDLGMIHSGRCGWVHQPSCSAPRFPWGRNPDTVARPRHHAWRTWDWDCKGHDRPCLLALQSYSGTLQLTGTLNVFSSPAFVCACGQYVLPESWRQLHNLTYFNAPFCSRHRHSYPLFTSGIPSDYPMVAGLGQQVQLYRTCVAVFWYSPA